MMIFREATHADIPAMSEIRLLVKENVLSNPGRITRQIYEDYLGPLGKGWVCELDGTVVGFSYAACEDHSIWALFIHPDHEGNGIGSRLLKLATDWLFERGASRVILSTEVNTRADRFYAAQGWHRGDIKGEFPEVVYTLERPAQVTR